MTAVALATACAVIFGTADFLGGLATRRSRVFAVVVLSQVGGLLLIGVLIPLLPGSVSPAALLWGMASGVAGAGALVLFYRGLATGMMSVVAPTTATTAMAVPVIFGLLIGERPSALALTGVVLACSPSCSSAVTRTARPPARASAPSWARSPPGPGSARSSSC
ncbi:hypothetical protein GCM10009530_28560 [Microbispora corallina]|uniref:EamA domain-containing protein n=1 Tax=Microbispora corallina TaxID=83302 RepID=A0ABQ4FZJ1_9ACTN|nr:hypothetical protein Mco01_32410 [Microbispora corallina]